MASAPYITPEGLFQLNQELSERWQRRREVVRALAAAAAEGDRSENAEYIYRKKELRELDRRIRYLQKRIPDLTVVHEPPDDTDRVFFAATIRLQTESDEQVQYRIVGPDEIDHQKGNISVDSPLARALLGKSVNDEAVIQVAGQHKQFTIVTITY
ncbi:Transcription elongation factor GreB [Methylophaga frappieri]|uniref:Transcription elongation factor GreB n=1 Tax=Methylophaga frappieri (strain ATCC BAA-2434 / DSM 25690 / JAM7) TaxID=754477 RepID=I1YL13_METFJ|nr:transcription elongation factor GreB [Methylophaga frappieri]AFJ03606.1 Transcription elongation factor GreB [Methylophaga frappieri]